MNHSGGSAHSRPDDLLVGIFLSFDAYRRVEGGGAEPEVRVKARVCRLPVDMHARDVRQQFLIQPLHMLMMGDMRTENRHLTSAYAGADVGHTVVVADGRVLVVRIGVTRLGGIPHDFIRILGTAADEGASAGSRNHLVAVERQHAVFPECSEHLPVEARAHPLGGVLDHRDSVFFGNRQNPVNMIWHSVQRHRDNRLRIPAGLFFPVNDGLLQQLRVHIPSFRLGADKHRMRSKIGNRV